MSTIEELKEALRFYADKENWIDASIYDEDGLIHLYKAIPVDRSQKGSPMDCGDIARKALGI